MSSESKEQSNLERVQKSYAELLKELVGIDRDLSKLPDPFQVYDKIDLQNRMIGIQQEFRYLKDNYKDVLSFEKWQAFEQGLKDLITPIQEKIGKTARNFQEEIEEDSEAFLDELHVDASLEEGKTEINDNTPRQLYTKGSKIEQDLEDDIRGIEQAVGIDKKKLRAEMQSGYSDYRATKSIPESIDFQMDSSGLKNILSKISTKNSAAIRSKNSNEIEGQLSSVIKLKGELKSALSALPHQMSDAQSAYSYVIKVAISELNKMKRTLNNELKPLQAIEYKQVRDAMSGMLEKGHNLDPLISRRDPNSPHKKFTEEFNSIEAKINAGNNPGQFLDRLHEMKAQLEKAKPKVIMGSRRSTAELAASVSAKAPVPAPPQNNRASTSEINITVNTDKISTGIDSLLNLRGISSISVQPLKAVSEYNRLRTEIASSNTVSPEMQKNLEYNRKILTQTMGFGEQIERLEKLSNDPKVLSSPANAEKMLAAVSKLSEKLESEVQKLEKKQKTEEALGRENPRINAATDVIDVALIKLDLVKSKVVQQIPAMKNAAEASYIKFDKK